MPCLRRLDHPRLAPEALETDGLDRDRRPSADRVHHVGDPLNRPTDG